MRSWPLPSALNPSSANGVAQASGLLAELVMQLGQAQFAQAALTAVRTVAPTASLSVYCIRNQRPTLYMSAAHGIPDATRQCWGAYLSGPQLQDQSWGLDGPALPGQHLVHVRASEVSPLHRQRVYEAHDVAERFSIAKTAADGSVFAVNFYRHQHQRPLADGHLSDFSDLSLALLALVQKQIALSQPMDLPAPTTVQESELHWRERLQTHAPGLTARELDVCLRLLRGMTQEGIAADLGLSVATVKTYRNRAFARLEIQHRNQLFALMLAAVPKNKV